MVRLKAPDYLTQEKDKSKLPERIEFIYYQERWEGKDHRGVPLNPVSEHIEGYWTKQFTRPHFNQENGEIDYNQLDTARAQTIYYIPYSKSSGRYYSQVSTHRQRQGQFSLLNSQSIIHLVNISKRQQETNFHMNNSVHGNGTTSVNIISNQLYRPIWNGSIKKSKKTVYPLTLLNLISIKII